MCRYKFHRVYLFLVKPERRQYIIFSSIPRNFCPPPKNKVHFRVNRIKREADFENSSIKLAIIFNKFKKKKLLTLVGFLGLFLLVIASILARYTWRRSSDCTEYLLTSFLIGIQDLPQSFGNRYSNTIAQP
jgi:hypothetical protein